MSSLTKIQKNAEKFKLNEFYRNMTPEQYRQGIEYAVKRREQELYSRFDRDFNKLLEEKTNEITMRNQFIRKFIFIELLYEIANQLECFVKEPEFLDQKIQTIKNIYENTLTTIEDYTKCKKSGQAIRKLEKKKKKLEKMFNVKF